MFDADRKRSETIKHVLDFHGSSEDRQQSGQELLTKSLIAGSSAVAAAIGTFLVTTHSGPDGKEMPSLLDKGTDWSKDLFKSKEEKQQEQEAIGSQIGPSPLTTPEVPKNLHGARPNKDVQDAIRQASSGRNVDYALLYAVAGAESSFRQTASATTSSAVGLFQFTDSTWKYLCDQYKLDYTSQDRNDPRKSAQVAGLYVRDINETLQRGLGRKPSYGEVYMGYFLGPSGALRFLKATEKSPNALGSELFPKAAKANPNVFFERGDQTKPLTLRQILAKQEGKILSYAKDADPNLDSQYAESTASPKNIQVSVVTPDRQKASINRTGTNVATSGTTQDNRSVGNVARAISQPVGEVTAHYERAPDITTDIGTSNVDQDTAAYLHLPLKQEQSIQLIRGRDDRVYVINS
jgi:hypothetical protein